MKQIFKTIPKADILIDLLRDNSIIEQNKYLINFSVYKKIVLNNDHIEFLNKLRDYYFISKHHYLYREFSYTSFITIVRHIAKINNIKYSYVYDKLMNYKYLKYTIYYKNQEDNNNESLSIYF